MMQNPEEITQVTKESEESKDSKQSKESDLKVDKPQVDKPQDTFPPVRRRSPKQIEWSRQLGKRSQQFKKAKQDRLANIKIPEIAPTQNEVDQNEADNEDESKINQNEVTTQNKSSYNIFFTVITGGIILCAFWCYKKYHQPHKSEPSKPDQHESSKSDLPRSSKTSGIISME